MCLKAIVVKAYKLPCLRPRQVPQGPAGAERRRGRGAPAAGALGADPGLPAAAGHGAGAPQARGPEQGRPDPGAAGDVRRHAGQWPRPSEVRTHPRSSRGIALQIKSFDYPVRMIWESGLSWFHLCMFKADIIAM